MVVKLEVKVENKVLNNIMPPAGDCVVTSGGRGLPSDTRGSAGRGVSPSRECLGLLGGGAKYFEGYSTYPSQNYASFNPWAAPTHPISMH